SRALARRVGSSLTLSEPRPSSSPPSTSTEPLQSSGASAASSAPSSRCTSQSSRSISSTVPSKYWMSIVPSSSSIATTSNSSPPFKRYQSPILGREAAMWNPPEGSIPSFGSRVRGERITPRGGSRSCYSPPAARGGRLPMLRLAYAAFKERVKFREDPMLEQPLKFFVVFFVVVEPISLIPLFSGLTRGATPEYRRRMAVKAVWVAALILVL